MSVASGILDALVDQQRIASDWAEALRAVDKEIDLKIDRCTEQVRGVSAYLPAEEHIWRAFEAPLADLRVIILGQDPYPNPKHAVGLSFSTGPGGPIPASLRNVYEELRAGGYSTPGDGDLSPWTDRGVMLLNRALTLPADPDARPRRHLRWWAPIIRSTAHVIAAEAKTRPIAALLWGVPAHRMGTHLGRDVEVFASSHPAPQGVGRSAGGKEAFRGSSPFAKVDQWFCAHRKPKVGWDLAD